MNFFLIFQAFIRGRKKVLTPRVTFFIIKKINITSFSTRVYIFCLSFLHYNVKNVTYFLTIKVFFFVNNGGCVIHAMIYSISLKFLFFFKYIVRCTNEQGNGLEMEKFCRFKSDGVLDKIKKKRTQNYFCLAVTNCKHGGMFLFYEVMKRRKDLTNHRAPRSLISSLYQKSAYDCMYV